jgi:hypothetical protein
LRVGEELWVRATLAVSYGLFAFDLQGSLVLRVVSDVTPPTDRGMYAEKKKQKTFPTKGTIIVAHFFALVKSLHQIS